MDEKYFGKPQVFALYTKEGSGSYLPYCRPSYKACCKPTPLEEMPLECTFEEWSLAWTATRGLLYSWPEMFFVLETDGLIRLDMLEGLYEGKERFQELARDKAMYNFITTIVDWATHAVYDKSKIDEYLTCDYGPLRKTMARLTKRRGAYVPVAG